MQSFFKGSFKRPLKPVSEQVIVITGASSGIGLATALSAAKKGARVVLAARNENALSAAQRKIEMSGGECIAISADVSDQTDIKRIVDMTVEAYGGFDTWVNCAGVGLLGRLDEISDEDHRRLFDTNFWGIVYGSLAAAAHLKNKQGAIINLGSLLSDVVAPLQGMYSASKHAIKGFTDAFRDELEADKSEISVTLIKPTAIATPFFEHQKNYTTQQPKAPPPVYAPEEVAYAILHSAEHRHRDVRVGGAGVLMAALGAHAPRLSDFLNAKFMIKAQVSDKPKSRQKDNLHESGEGSSVYGKDMPYALNSLYTRASLNPAITTLAFSALGAIAYAAYTRKTTPYARLGKTAFSGLNAALNAIGPLQNAVIAKALVKYFEDKSEMASKSIRKNSKVAGKAVNENAALIKKKAISIIK